MVMSMCLPKFHIHHKLKQTQTLDVLILFKKRFVRSETHLVPRNIVSTGQSVGA